jgi:nucleoside-diphosphate-sugar epimerase
VLPLMRFEHLEWRPADQKVFVADVSAAVRDLGWRPEVGVEEGLASMLEWTREMADAG